MHSKLKTASVLIGCCVCITCGGDGEEASNASAAVDHQPRDCETVDTSELSTFLTEPFQRDLAIDIPSKVLEHLENEPALICATYTSSRYGDLSAIAYAAAHRPDAEMIFPVLVERGARMEDALPVAAHQGKTRMIEWLLERGVDPGFGDALVFAAAEQETRAFLLLLEAGAYPNVQAAPNPWTGELQRTPLHYAALHGSHEMLEALFAAGADLDAPDADHRPPLALAVDERKLQAIRALIDKGARPRRLSRDDQEKFRTIAKQRRWDDVLDELR